MESLEFVSSIFTFIYWLAFGIIAVCLLYRIITIFIKRRERKFIGNIEGNTYPKIFKLLFGITMLLFAINAWFYLNIASPLKSFIPDYLNLLLLAVVTMLGLLEVGTALTVSDSLLRKIFKRVALTVIVAFLLPLNVYFGLSIPDMFTYPPEEDSYIIDLPVRGTWSAGHAGGSTAVNYHHALRSQQYAIDITKINERGEFYRDTGMHLTDHYSMGETVYSPVAGVVVRKVDGLPNGEITFAPSEYDNPAGNYVVINFSEDRFLFLAHLDSMSIQTEIGDSVTTGQPVGRIGNSGNTSWPHLHMHIQDLPDLDNENATGYPFRFSSMERKRWFAWRNVTNGFLVRNDRFRER